VVDYVWLPRIVSFSRIIGLLVKPFHCSQQSLVFPIKHIISCTMQNDRLTKSTLHSFPEVVLFRRGPRKVSAAALIIWNYTIYGVTIFSAALRVDRSGVILIALPGKTSKFE
jgi:hypothetical protein